MVKKVLRMPFTVRRSGVVGFVAGREGCGRAARGALVQLAAAAWALAVAPGLADAQLARLLQTLRDGGGWARFAVEGGRGGYRSSPVPVAGLSLSGCFQVVQPRTGAWTITARDMLGDGKIEATVAAGEPVRFSYEAGFRTRLDVVVEWSEPRDTTLVLWVGLDTLADEDRDSCRPPPPGSRPPRPPEGVESRVVRLPTDGWRG